MPKAAIPPATAAQATATTSRRPAFSRLQQGQVLAEMQYYTVDTVDANSDTAVLVNDAGRKIKVSRGIIENDMTSANQFTEEREVSLTEASNILQGAGSGVFSVNYLKKADRESIAAYADKYIASLGGARLGGAIIPGLGPKQIVNDGGKGEERTLVGHLISAEPRLAARR